MSFVFLSESASVSLSLKPISSRTVACYNSFSTIVMEFVFHRELFPVRSYMRKLNALPIDMKTNIIGNRKIDC